MSRAALQEIGSWTLAIMSLAGSYGIGNKRRGAWLWMFFTQAIWIAYGALTRQTGFVASGLGFGAMNLRNWLRWRREEQAASYSADSLASRRSTRAFSRRSASST